MADRGRSTWGSAGDPRANWADRFAAQARACGSLGSDLYRRLLDLLARELSAGASTWDLLGRGDDLRFGQAAPLRLLGAAHRLALSGAAPGWATCLPSCGGTVPSSDEALLAAWRALVEEHRGELEAGLSREAQTNEVARSAGLALAIALCAMREIRLVELGCSAGLNLRLDRFCVDLGGMVQGHAESPVRLRPEMRGSLDALRHEGLVLAAVTERVGIDPHPVDPATREGALTLRSFVWPDQLERLALLEAAIGIARGCPAELIRVAGTAQPQPSQPQPSQPQPSQPQPSRTERSQTEPTHDRQARSEPAQPEEPDAATVLARLLGQRIPTVVMESIVWQYMPSALRWRITEAIETAGARATTASPLVWVRYEPDEWDRRRAAIWSRTFPGGSDHLVAHICYHGRWIAPIAPPGPL